MEENTEGGLSEVASEAEVATAGVSEGTEEAIVEDTVLERWM